MASWNASLVKGKERVWPSRGPVSWPSTPLMTPPSTPYENTTCELERASVDNLNDSQEHMDLITPRCGQDSRLSEDGCGQPLVPNTIQPNRLSTPMDLMFVLNCQPTDRPTTLVDLASAQSIRNSQPLSERHTDDFGLEGDLPTGAHGYSLPSPRDGLMDALDSNLLERSHLPIQSSDCVLAGIRSPTRDPYTSLDSMEQLSLPSIKSLFGSELCAPNYKPAQIQHRANGGRRRSAASGFAQYHGSVEAELPPPEMIILHDLRHCKFQDSENDIQMTGL